MDCNSEAKVALLYEDKIVIFQRPDDPDKPFPRLWDFPGAKGEAKESPFETIRREIKKRCGVVVIESGVIWERVSPPKADPVLPYFFVIKLTDKEVEKIGFNKEGQVWKLINMQDFLRRSDFVPHLKSRFQDYLSGRSSLLY